ncbi:MAG: hypothetical protein ABI216_22025 [Devosia sp.]
MDNYDLIFVRFSEFFTVARLGCVSRHAKNFESDFLLLDCVGKPGCLAHFTFFKRSRSGETYAANEGQETAYGSLAGCGRCWHVQEYGW